MICYYLSKNFSLPVSDHRLTGIIINLVVIINNFCIIIGRVCFSVTITTLEFVNVQLSKFLFCLFIFVKMKDADY